jgi:hypothetical protein
MEIRERRNLFEKGSFVRELRGEISQTGNISLRILFPELQISKRKTA